MKQLYIIGSGGLAREVAYLVEDIKRSSNSDYDLGSFIDNSTEERRIIGKESFSIISEDVFLSDPNYNDAYVVVGIGNPQLLQKIITKFRTAVNTFQFPNLIHPSVHGHWDSIAIGEGNIITAGCTFTVGITVGSFNIFNLHSTVGHDTRIGDFNVINPGSNISGDVKIGNRNLLGTNCAILQGVAIENDCIVGGNGLLAKNLESNLVAVGVPAKPIKNNIA